MVRDFELIRAILFKVQSIPAGTCIEIFELDCPVAPAVLAEHLALLIEAGFVRGDFARNRNGLCLVSHISGLTWDGHDFIGSIKDDGVWQQVREKVLCPAASLTFDVLKEWLKVQSLRTLGIA